MAPDIFSVVTTVIECVADIFIQFNAYITMFRKNKCNCLECKFNRNKMLELKLFMWSNNIHVAELLEIKIDGNIILIHQIVNYFKIVKQINMGVVLIVQYLYYKF